MGFIPQEGNIQMPNECTSPEHNPPQMMLRTKLGVWQCPKCGFQTPIIVANITQSKESEKIF